MLLRNETEILLRDLQATMSCCNISILHILVVEQAQSPVRLLLAFRIFKLGDLAEQGHLLDQALQSTDMDRKAGVIGAGV